MSSWPLSHDPTTCSVKTGSFCVAPVWGLGVGFQPNHLQALLDGRPCGRDRSVPTEGGVSHLTGGPLRTAGQGRTLCQLPTRAATGAHLALRTAVSSCGFLNWE